MSPLKKSFCFARRLLIRFKFGVIGVGLCVAATAHATTPPPVHHETVMCYNVENAFWPTDDPTRADEAFTPAGTYHWTHTRLRRKLLQLTRVILAAGQGRPPMLVGLAEVEGDSVLQYWTQHTPLRTQGYRYCCSDGHDARGIEVALLYQPSDFKLIADSSYAVDVAEGHHPTRPVLHAAGRVRSGDTLDILMCHLPSRLGGVKGSEPARALAKRRLTTIADSLHRVRSRPYILIMGDMNEFPNRNTHWWNTTFDNLMEPLQRALINHPAHYGSHKYQGQWGFLDQFIASRTLLTDTLPARGLRASNARVFSLPFMMTDDATHLGHRPLRSYYGQHYEGGYSDHLPICLSLDIAF